MEILFYKIRIKNNISKMEENIREPDPVIKETLIDDFVYEDDDIYETDENIRKAIKESKLLYQEETKKRCIDIKIEKLKKECEERAINEKREMILLKQKHLSPIIKILLPIKNSDENYKTLYSKIVEFNDDDNNCGIIKLDSIQFDTFEKIIDEYYNIPLEKNIKPKLKQSEVRSILLYIKKS
uniref:Uncharacterized protein n=1 Tax=viral metagenome TaxID=1070528 RepID=A0A6C0H6Y6_9ZZZZ